MYTAILCIAPEAAQIQPMYFAHRMDAERYYFDQLERMDILNFRIIQLPKMSAEYKEAILKLVGEILYMRVEIYGVPIPVRKFDQICDKLLDMDAETLDAYRFAHLHQLKNKRKLHTA